MRCLSSLILIFLLGSSAWAEMRELKEVDPPNEFQEAAKKCEERLKWRYRYGLAKDHKWIGAFATRDECEAARKEDPKAPKGMGFAFVDCEQVYNGPTIEAKVAALEYEKKTDVDRPNVTLPVHFVSMVACEAAEKSRFKIPGMYPATDDFARPIENEFVSPFGSKEFPFVKKRCHEKSVIVCRDGDDAIKEIQFFE